MAPIWHYTKRVAGIGGGIGVVTHVNPVVQVLLVCAVLLTVMFPIVAATALYTWHSVHGTKPGLGGQLLYKLIALVLGRHPKQ